MVDRVTVVSYTKKAVLRNASHVSNRRECRMRNGRSLNPLISVSRRIDGAVSSAEMIRELQTVASASRTRPARTIAGTINRMRNHFCAFRVISRTLRLHRAGKWTQRVLYEIASSIHQIGTRGSPYAYRPPSLWAPRFLIRFFILHWSEVRRERDQSGRWTVVLYKRLCGWAIGSADYEITDLINLILRVKCVDIRHAFNRNITTGYNLSCRQSEHLSIIKCVSCDRRMVVNIV